jgi:hypothetical protein
MHELTPSVPLSAYAKRWMTSLLAPSLRSREGVGGEFMRCIEGVGGEFMRYREGVGGEFM